MKRIFFSTFAKAAVLPYVGGTIFHVLRLTLGFPIEEMPDELDWVVIVVGGYACAGFLRFAREVRFKGPGDKLLYLLVIVHLGVSVVLHAYSLIVGHHEWATVFPRGYSYFAVFYFVVLGAYCVALSRRLGTGAARP